MILTKLYRLQKKKGAVLFVVIAMMTLLIIMATTAYMTARSSYKTVVNNYDFSQLYLSAVSVSDMMVAAVTNDTVDSGSSAQNNFADLKKAVTSKDFAVGETITAKSNNITSSMTTLESILKGTANNPIEAGVLDGVEVVITHESKEDVLDDAKKPTGKSLDYYLFTTTAYYRNNTVQIQDRIARESGSKPNSPKFDTFFTATGQILNGDKAEKDASRCAVINTHSISDDAYFENTYTAFVMASGSNKFKGGITTAGHLYLDKMDSDIPNATPATDPTDWNADSSAKVSGTRNDWYIGGSLFLAEHADIKLGNNNLYVNGDLILLDSTPITAKNVYVTGNVFYAGTGTATSTLNCNLYVGGTVCCNLNTMTAEERKKAEENNEEDKIRLDDAKIKALNDMGSFNNAYKSVMAQTGGTVADLPNTNAKGDNTGILSISGGLYVNDKANLHSALNSAWDGNWSASGIKVPFEFQEVTDTDGDKIGDKYSNYVNYKDYNAFSASDTKTQTSVFSSYSAGDGTDGTKNTMNNFLTIDFGTLKADDAGNYNAAFASTSGEIARVTGNKQNLTVNLPYSANGYVLDLKVNNGYAANKMINGQLNVTYKIDSDNSGAVSGAVLPIVLKANFNDNSGYPLDSAGNNSFSWTGGGVNWEGKVGPYGADGYPVKVEVQGGGDVFFEMGNYDATGNYTKYELGKGLNTATYYTSPHSVVGTTNQVNSITPGNQDTTTYDSFFAATGSADLSSTHDNQIMLISNKNGGKAIDNNRKGTNFCGYVYAPNGDYMNWNTGGGGAPVLGGMIVSNYAVELSNFVYAEPDPSLIENLNKALPNKDTPSELGSEIWYVSDPDKGAGSNFLG